MDEGRVSFTHDLIAESHCLQNFGSECVDDDVGTVS